MPFAFFVFDEKIQYPVAIQSKPGVNHDDWQANRLACMLKREAHHSTLLQTRSLAHCYSPPVASRNPAANCSSTELLLVVSTDSCFGEEISSVILWVVDAHTCFLGQPTHTPETPHTDNRSARHQEEPTRTTQPQQHNSSHTGSYDTAS